jgi:hypothetical protein
MMFLPTLYDIMVFAKSEELPSFQGKMVLRASSHELVVELSCMWRESHELLLTLFFFLKVFNDG